MNLSIRTVNANGRILASAGGESEVILVYDAEYTEGDSIIVESAEPKKYILLQLDDTIAPTFTYLKTNQYIFHIPFEVNRASYSPRSFTGTRHLLSVRIASPEEIAVRKNLAFNPWDTHENKSIFPHASANVETRGEAVFAARNAIDGLKANTFHGEWPYSSWGINCDPNAALKLDFGRRVNLNQAVFYLRADFPHDAWWEHAALHFSDNSNLTINLKKTGAAQSIYFEPKITEWIILDSLVKAENPSPFPALTQIEFYGTEVL